MPAPLRMDEKDGGLHLHFRLQSEVHARSHGKGEQRSDAQRRAPRPNGLNMRGARRAARIPGMLHVIGLYRSTRTRLFYMRYEEGFGGAACDACWSDMSRTNSSVQVKDRKATLDLYPSGFKMRPTQLCIGSHNRGGAADAASVVPVSSTRCEADSMVSTPSGRRTFDAPTFVSGKRQ